MSAATNAFYQRVESDRFSATPATMSPWDAGLQHGGPPTALVAHEVLRRHPREDMRIARIAVEFLGPVPRQVVSVRTRIVRPGRRIELLEASLEIAGREVLISRIWRIATSKDTVLGSAPSTVIPPLPGEQPQRHFPGLAGWGYGEAIEWRFTSGHYDQLGPAHVWTRVRFPLVADEPAQPLDGMLVVADSANGLSAELPLQDWLFVPPSVSIALQRYPQGEWTFMAARTTLTGDGIGLTTAELADPVGFVGVLNQTLLVERRPGR